MAFSVLKMTITALVVTAIVFLMIFASVSYDPLFHDAFMLLSLIFLVATPVPLLLLRCCSSGDGIMSSAPKGRHWAEFWSAFLFASTIALPATLWMIHMVSNKALILSLSGVLLAVSFVCCCAFLQVRADGDSYQSW